MISLTKTGTILKDPKDASLLFKNSSPSGIDLLVPHLSEDWCSVPKLTRGMLVLNRRGMNFKKIKQPPYKQHRPHELFPQLSFPRHHLL